MLSSTELHYVFIRFLNKATTLRENSSVLDKLILQLDVSCSFHILLSKYQFYCSLSWQIFQNTIVDKEIRLRYLNESYNKLRDTCTSLRSKSKLLPVKPSNEKLEAIINAHRNSSSPDKSSTESSVSKGIFNRVFKSVAMKSNLMKQIDICVTDESSSSNFLRNLSQRSFRVLQGNSTKSFGVTRQGKKLIIQQNKNPWR